MPVPRLVAGVVMNPTAQEQAALDQQRAQQEEGARSAVMIDAVARLRERAVFLTKQAAAAARAGDCDTVSVRESEVRELDAEVHATVFARDIAIKRCLDAARTTVVPAPAVEAAPAVEMTTP